MNAEQHARGARGSWASNGGLWANAASRLLLSTHFPETILGCVALYLAVKNAMLLTTGRQPVPPDPDAGVSCPYRPEELSELEQRMSRIRDHILHHADRISEGGGFELSLPKRIVTTTRITKQGTEIETLALADGIRIAEQLAPWFQGQLTILTPEPGPDLADKIKAVMEGATQEEAEA